MDGELENHHAQKGQYNHNTNCSRLQLFISIRQKLGKHHPDHSTRSQTKAEGKHGFEGTYEQVSGNGHQWLRQAAENTPAGGLGDGHASWHQDKCNGCAAVSVFRELSVTTEESSVIACFPNNLARDEDS